MINLDMIRQWAAELAEYRDDEEAYTDTLDGVTDYRDVLTVLLRKDMEAGAMVEALKAEEGRLKARRDRIARAKAATRDMIARVMEAAEVRSEKLPLATLSVRMGEPRVEITDPGAVPTQLCAQKVVLSPDRAAIRAQIEAGEAVPGAVLEPARPILTVRVA